MFLHTDAPCSGATILLRNKNAKKLEVQSIIKIPELRASFCLLKKVTGPIKVPVDNKGIIDGLRRGERKCIDPKAGDADLWIKIWEELHLLMSKEILVEVEHVKTHRTKKDKKDVAIIEILSLKAMRKRMSWQKQGQCWTKDSHGADESKNIPARTRRGVCSLAVCRQLSLLGGRMERL